MSQGLAAAVLDQMTESIAVLDQHGGIVAVNEAWRRVARMGGATSLNDEASGQNYLAICDATTGPDGSTARAAAAGIRAVINGELPSFKLEYPCHSPAVRRWFLVRVTPLSSDLGCVVVQHVDITARKLAEAAQARLYDMAQSAQREALQDAQQLEAMFTAIQDGLVVLDQNGIIIGSNAADGALLAQGAPNPTVPESVWERAQRLRFQNTDGTPLPLDGTPASRVLRGEALPHDQPVDVRAHLADGRQIDISVTGAPMSDVQGQLIGGVLVYRDVTQRRQLERRARKALQAMLAMAKAITMPHMAEQSDSCQTDGAWCTDGVALRLAELAHQVLDCVRLGIARVDPATGDLLPVARLGLSQAHVEQLLHQGRNFRLADLLSLELIERLRAGEVVVTDATAIAQRGLPTLDAREFLVAPLCLGNRLLGTLIMDFGGQPHIYTPEERALAGAVGDLAAVVLESRRLQQEARDAEARAVAAREVTRQMDGFFAMAAHDIRSPVTAAEGFVHVALRRAEQLADARQPRDGHEAERVARVVDALSAASESTDRLVRMTELLFDVARARAGSLEISLRSRDLAEVVRTQVLTQRAAAPARRIHLRMPHSTAPVMADADRLGEVLANYLTNALKYSPEDKPVEVRLTVAKGRATVSVRDHGPGLPAAEQSRVWELFHRAPGVEVQSSSAGAGSLGLGLHVSKRLVELHPGGRVGLKSAVGHGSTFSFSLPLALTA
jgi:signal transduction histidine kinase